MSEETKEVKEPKVKKETVTVDKKALEDILKDIADLKAKNERLEAVADKSRLAWYEGVKGKKKELQSITLGTFPTKDGYKIIKGWSSMPINEMYQDSNGVFHERQTVELWLDDYKPDDGKLMVNYVDFPRRKVSVRANVLSRQIDEETGYETLKVETTEGPKKTLEIDSRFINI